MAESILAQRHVQVDNTAFVGVTFPIGCNSIVVRNGNAGGGIALRVSTDPNNADAYDLVPAGDQKLIAAADLSGPGRFQAGQVYLYFKADAVGTVDIFLTFTP